jgi:hypothetical protein
MSMGPLRVRARRCPFDWQHDEDGPFTDLDRELVLAVLEKHPDRPARDAGRKLRRYLDEVAAR